MYRSEVVAACVDDLGWVEYGPDVDDQEAVEGWVLSVSAKVNGCATCPSRLAS